MASNTFGKLFSISTCGESHGSAMLCIVDGCPAGMELSVEDIQPALDRRRPGRSRYTSQRREPDKVEILSGIFEGKTTGAPIGLMVRNQDQRSADYDAVKNIYRPGHADITYQQKYGIRDYRGGGRASARETVSWVAAGAIAQKYLHLKHDIKVTAYLSQLGEHQLAATELTAIDDNEFFCAETNKIAELQVYLEQLRKQRDSIGAAVTVIAENVPAGLGEPVFAKLNADIAHAMMSINAAKAVEIGDGFAVVTQRGSEHRDAITPTGYASNHSGGILGGISTGQTLKVRVAFKPTSSIPQAIPSIDINGQATEVTVTGRHDPCVGIRAVPIVQAMLANVLLDHILRMREI